MPTYLWECEECSQQERVFRSMKDYLVPPSEGESDNCSSVDGHVWMKQTENPMVLKASFVSGQRMKSDQSYADYAKSLELDCQLPNHRRNSEEYKEMKKESNRLKGRDTGETTRSAGSGKTRGGT